VLPGCEVKLAEDGEILVRGGGVASGYWDARGAQGASDRSIPNEEGGMGPATSARSMKPAIFISKDARKM